MGKSERAANRRTYFSRLYALMEANPKLMIVSADHVGSRQMANIRMALRGKAAVLMGKNTMIRTAIKQKIGDMPKLEALLPYIKLNIGFIFCMDDLSFVRSIIDKFKVPAPARQGVYAPIDVFIPAGPTGMDPGSTSFFQALGISTKIVKGQIEIQSDVHLIKMGEKVTASAASLLNKLSIRPFEYGLKIQNIYDDGSVFSSSVLDISDETILTAFKAATQNVAALSRSIGLPTQASTPHAILEAFKMCVSVCLDSDFVFPEMEKLKQRIENPDAFVAVVTTTQGGGGGGGAAVGTTTKKVVEEEPEEEDDADMGFSLFD